DAEVLALAFEHGVFAHGDGDREVAGLAAIWARLALAFEADLLTVGDPRRNAYGEWFAVGTLQLHGVSADGGAEVEGCCGDSAASLGGATVTTVATTGGAEVAAAEHSAENIVEVGTAEAGPLAAATGP